MTLKHYLEVITREEPAEIQNAILSIRERLQDNTLSRSSKRVLQGFLWKMLISIGEDAEAERVKFQLKADSPSRDTLKPRSCTLNASRVSGSNLRKILLHGDRRKLEEVRRQISTMLTDDELIPAKRIALLSDRYNVELKLGLEAEANITAGQWRTSLREAGKTTSANPIVWFEK